MKTGRCSQLRQRDSVCNNAPVSCFRDCHFSAKILYINLNLMFALRFSEQKKRTLPVKCLDVASHLVDVTRPGVNPARDPKKGKKCSRKRRDTFAFNGFTSDSCLYKLQILTNRHKLNKTVNKKTKKL